MTAHEKQKHNLAIIKFFWKEHLLLYLEGNGFYIFWGDTFIRARLLLFEINDGLYLLFHEEFIFCHNVCEEDELGVISRHVKENTVHVRRWQSWGFWSIVAVIQDCICDFFLLKQLFVEDPLQLNSAGDVQSETKAVISTTNQYLHLSLTFWLSTC